MKQFKAHSVYADYWLNHPHWDPSWFKCLNAQLCTGAPFGSRFLGEVWKAKSSEWAPTAYRKSELVAFDPLKPVTTVQKERQLMNLQEKPTRQELVFVTTLRYSHLILSVNRLCKVYALFYTNHQFYSLGMMADEH